MKLEEGQIIYACLNEHPTQCRITALNFGGDGVHLVLTLLDRQSYIVSEDEISDDAEECLENHRKRVEKEYKIYHEMVNSPTALILHLLHAAINGKKIDGIEKRAIIDRASQFTQIDVEEYLAKLDKIEKESRKNNEKEHFG